MGWFSRYFLPLGVRRLVRPALAEAKLLLRVWANVLLPHRLWRYRRLLRQPLPRLHLGCGGNRLRGWVNVDMGPKGDLTIDLREELPFASDSVDAIYSEHALEHFERVRDAPFLLGECLRVLRPGAPIRLVVPDAEATIRYYVGTMEEEQAAAYERVLLRIGGTRMDVVNTAFRWKHQHLYMYDEETLRALMQEVGFTEIHRRACQESPVEALRAIDREERRPLSLYVEARKPAGAAT
jgi:predicted SAM-dependent methyltransferase